MRVLLPGIRLRRRIRKLLASFFETYKESDFDEAIRLLSEFYKIKRPKIRWYEQLGYGHTLGETAADGTISLVHPENFKTMKPCAPTKTLHGFSPTRAAWIGTLIHEFNHYLNFPNDEANADDFARKFVLGLGDA